MSLTEQLAELTVGQDPEIPITLYKTAKEVILDGLAVTLAGATEPSGMGCLTRTYVAMTEGSPEASVIASNGYQTSMGQAAYANGTLCHALDYDNTWPPLAHPTSPVLPAILAIGENYVLDMGKLLEALIVSYEVQGRLRLATSELSMPPTFHNGVSGTIGATAAASRLLGLTTTETCHAYGIAGSRACSLSVNSGTMTKATHSGHAARMGIESALLAMIGWTAHDDIFGSGRFFEVFFDGIQTDTSALIKNFGKPYRLQDPGIGYKLYPSNYFTHRAIEAAISLFDQGVKAESIETIVISFPPFDYVNRPSPRTALEGKFSVQYCAAVSLLDGRINLNSFAPDRYKSSDIHDLLAKTHVQYHDDIPTDFESTYVVIDVLTKSGELISARCDKPRGMWGCPPTEKERHNKVVDCVSSGFSAGIAAELIRRVESHELKDDITDLMSWLSSLPLTGAGE